MTTTLSDEEFQRLNDQLLNLKAENYNLEISLQKCSNDCQSLRIENDELKQRSSTSFSSVKQVDQNNIVNHLLSSPTAPPTSIKQKLNPFALAKSIANKVDSRIQNSKNQQESIVTGNVHNNNNSSFEQQRQLFRLESQESDFIKTNEMLKNEICLLQSTIELLEADKKYLLKEISAKTANSSEIEQKPNENIPKSSSIDVATSTVDSPTIEATTVPDGPSLPEPCITVDTGSNTEQEIEPQSQLDIGAQFEPYFALLSISESESDNSKFESIKSFFHELFDSKLNSQDFEKNIELSVEKIEELFVVLNREIDANLVKAEEDNDNDNNNVIRDLFVRLCNLVERRHLSRRKVFLEYLFKKINEKYREITDESEEKFTEYEKKILESDKKIEEIENELVLAKQESNNLNEKFMKDLTEKELSLEKMKAELDEKNREIELKDSELDEQKRSVDLLEAKILESVNEHKISEKRGLKIIKELKKELTVEKNRANRLQLRLQELLNNSNCGGVGDLDTTNAGTRSIDSQQLQPQQHSVVPIGSDRCSSSGSWSYMNEANSSKNPTEHYNGSIHSIHSESSDMEIVGKIDGQGLHQSPSSNSLKKDRRVQSSNNLVSNNTLEHENAHLVTRISNLQQEKWRLDEQVNQLEHETRRLAEELALKNKLIEHYCIEGHRQPTPQTSFDSQPSTPQTPTGGAKRNSTTFISSPYATNTGRHQSSSQSPYPLTSHSSFSSSSSNFSSPVSASNTLNNSVLRVVGFLKEKGDDLVRNSGQVVGGLASIGDHSHNAGGAAKQMAETNRKLQRMVEEVLTKNMHLQADLELMSNQVMALKSEIQEKDKQLNNQLQ